MKMSAGRPPGTGPVRSERAGAVRFGSSMQSRYERLKAF
jgi:hypothetical protein